MNAVHPLQGHNNPPSPFEELVEEIDSLYDEAKNWCDGEPVNSDAQEKAVADLMSLIRDAEKRADAMRKEETKPLDEAKQEIQDKFNKLIGKNKSVTGKTVLALETCKKAVEPYRQKKAEMAAEQARIEREKALEADRIAQEALKAASASSDLEQREQAEALVHDAKQTEKTAKKANKAATSGLGLRKSYRAEITDFTKAAQHFWRLTPEPYKELTRQLAQQHANRQGGDVPGVKVHLVRSAI